MSSLPRISLPLGDFAHAVRHLAIAAEGLAREAADDPTRSARFRRAEAAYRSLADAEGSRPSGGPSPTVAIDDQATVSLAELLARGWESLGKRHPGRGIDPEMIEAARQLLLELAWRLPV